jgi:APA family basic amino acid/polyamine antiporter
VPEQSKLDDALLVRALGSRDATLVTVGATLGTGIFLTTAAVATSAPDPRGILLLWLAGGLLALAGALTYAELGSMFPTAGGQYVYLKEAYGPLPGFLFGWVSFFVIMTGGIAVLAVGFGEYLGAFVPFFGTGNVLWKVPLRFGSAAGFAWTATGAQLAGAIAIAGLTAINYVGVVAGTGFQNVVTAAKIGALVLLGAAGLFLPAKPGTFVNGPSIFPMGLAAAGVGMIAVQWTYDGWYGATFMAGEMKDPRRSLPIGIIAGTLIVTALYLLMNVVYLRALPVAELVKTPRVAEASALALFGTGGGRLITTLVLVTIFGCLASTILYPPRIYMPMSRDGLFFAALGRVHHRYRTPAASLVAQAIWGIALTFSGTYEQLYTYVIFAVFLFHAATGAAVVVLRRSRPEAERTFRVPAYPWIPLLFVGVCLALVVNTLIEKPAESGVGLAILAAGVPAYLFWRRRSAAAGAIGGKA